LFLKFPRDWLGEDGYQKYSISSAGAGGVIGGNDCAE
jgi:hypothetical protein